jgi:hypothetical protein
VDEHRHDLARRGLEEDQMNPGKHLLERRDDPRQRVPRLRVGRSDGQAPLIAIAETLGQILDVLGVEQHPVHDLREFLAGIGETEQSLAFAHEQLHTELVLEILDVLAHSGLRSEDGVGDFGQIEVAADGFADDAQLLEIHCFAPIGASPTPSPRLSSRLRPSGAGRPR